MGGRRRFSSGGDSHVDLSTTRLRRGRLAGLSQNHQWTWPGLSICNLVNMLKINVTSINHISKLLTSIGPSLVFYSRPIEEWFSLSHVEIGQSPPSFS